MSHYINYVKAISDRALVDETLSQWRIFRRSRNKTKPATRSSIGDVRAFLVDARDEITERSLWYQVDPETKRQILAIESN